MMEKKITRALCRNVFEMCGVIKAKAIVIIESDKGERLWAANGPLREEFLNEGRIINADDTEIDLGNAERATAVYDGDDTEDGADGPIVDNGSIDPATGPSAVLLFDANTFVGQKRKTDEKVLRPASQGAKKIRKDKSILPSLQESPKRPLKPSEDLVQKKKEPLRGCHLREQQLKFAGLTQKMYWHGKNAIQWLKIAKNASDVAVSDPSYSQWHLDHPVVVDAEWHIMMYLRFRLHRKNDVQEKKTSVVGFWGNLKSRNICDKCLCFSGAVTIDSCRDQGLMKRPLHDRASCETKCCGLTRCRVCAHAHEEGTPCVCPCWVDSLKAVNIIPAEDNSRNSLAQYFNLPPSKGKGNDKVLGKTTEPQEGTISNGSNTLSTAAASASTTRRADSPAPLAVKTASSIADDELDDAPGYASKSSSKTASMTAKAKASVPKIVKAEMIEWRENDLATNLHLVSDIIVREAKKDHQPLHDLSAHLTLWLENATAGRYSSFFSHVLVNGFCQGCCCFMEEPSGSDEEEEDDVVIVEKSKTHCNKHMMAECLEKCCGEFLCKLCLHRHPIDGDCDCQCVVTALDALGLLENDAEKVQESTRKRWEKIHKGKIAKKVLDEINDW